MLVLIIVGKAYMLFVSCILCSVRLCGKCR